MTWVLLLLYTEVIPISNIGNKVKKQRMYLGLTQEELARKLGYKSKTTINKIEAGVNDVPRKRINDFAIALETTPEFFLECDSFSEHASAHSSTNGRVTHFLDIDIPTSEEEAILFYYRKLSKLGQSVAKERMKELTEIPKYVEKNDK